MIFIPGANFSNIEKKNTVKLLSWVHQESNKIDKSKENTAHNVKLFLYGRNQEYHE